MNAMGMRGYAAIGLDRPKDIANIGGALRAAGCYGASLVVIGGDRMGKYQTDTQKAYRHMPCLEVSDVMTGIPYGAVPVVIEICQRAKSLINFHHPQSAFYIFGPEDGSVQKQIIDAVPFIISVPTRFCMNLAATVNVVLYDRLAKQ